MVAAVEVTVAKSATPAPVAAAAAALCRCVVKAPLLTAPSKSPLTRWNASRQSSPVCPVSSAMKEPW
jgi:hypothetical protein